MLTDANLPKLYWLEAINYATLLHNLSPSHFISTTPSELYTSTKLNVLQLHVFGCCHSLVAMTGYSDLCFLYQTASFSFLTDDLISSPLPIVVARYFFTLPVPSLSFLLFLSPSRTFHSRLLYVPLQCGTAKIDKLASVGTRYFQAKQILKL